MRKTCGYCGKTFITMPDDDEAMCDQCIRGFLGDDPEYADA